ncbi:MAG TPA: FadR/GntR family transcriptional regulator [Chthonomonadaceae bacterium]|nr:FadR/GntR family transcriptional regulator [Chthonomonadaceae bacterium]
MPRTEAMKETVSSTRSKSVSEDVLEQIKTLVRNNHYRPGSRLPSERDLAQQLGVSRPSVRHALSTLARMGILETRRGSGTLVSDTSANILKAPFELLMILDQPTVFDLYDIREVLEVHLAGRAAERRTAEDLAALRTALDAMRAGLEEAPEQMHEPNVAFHQAIAVAAHNPVAARIISCLHEGIRACTEAATPGVRDWRASYEIHERIFDAIRRQSATDARRAMTIHMAMAYDELQRQLPRADGENTD